MDKLSLVFKNENKSMTLRQLEDEMASNKN